MQAYDTVETPESQVEDPVKFLLPLYRFSKGENQPDYTAQRRPTAELLAFENGQLTGKLSLTEREDIVKKHRYPKPKQFIENHENANIYFSSTVHKLLTGTEERKKDNFFSLPAIIADIDFYKSDDPPDNPDQWILKRCERYDLNRPHFIIHSSRLGRQVVWLTYRESEKLQRDRKKLVERIKLVKKKMVNQVFYPHADKDQNPIQLFRLPGSTNNKPNRNGYEVTAYQYEDTEVLNSFYKDLFGPLYEVMPVRKGSTTQTRSGPTESDSNEDKATRLNKIKGGSNGSSKAVLEWYEDSGPAPEGSNSYPITAGYILLLKGLGNSPGKITQIINDWSGNEIKTSQVKALVRWAFAGTSMEGELEGKGWSVNYARQYIKDLELKTLLSAYADFTEPVRIEDVPERENLSRKERVRRVISTLQGLGAVTQTVQMSIKELARKANVPESSLRYDLRNGIFWELAQKAREQTNSHGIFWFIRKSKNGSVSKWQLIRSDNNHNRTLLKSIKLLLYIYVVYGRSSTPVKYNTPENRKKTEVNDNTRIRAGPA